MKSKGNAPTAAQKRWREAVREVGQRGAWSDLEIHHPVGATGKHNKQDIGHWWVVPVDSEAHKAIHRGDFGKDRKQMEKALFNNCLSVLQSEQFKDLPPTEAIEAIMDYRR